MGCAGPFAPLHRYEAVGQALGEVSGHADAKYVAVLAEHFSDCVDEGVVNAAALAAVDMEGVVLRSVFVVAVKEKASEPRRVPGHEQPGAFRRKSAEDRLKYLILDAARLVYDVKNVLRVEALKGVRFARGSGYREPFFPVAFHKDLFLRP